MSAPRQSNVIITNAIPYANGPLHLGHLIGYLHADFYKAFRSLQGAHCLHLCGSDVHGTPIMLHAREKKQPETALWSAYKERHLRVLEGFQIKFDVWGDTHSAHHQKVVRQVYAQLQSQGLIYKKIVPQFYDLQAEMFLSDRLIKGTCPFCNASQQYADACEACGKSYGHADLLAPKSILSGQPPVMRDSEQTFFRLSQFKHIFTEMPEYLSPEACKALSAWQQKTLEDWCISRDAPYYGIRIPATPGKYFYVWFDAILAYLSLVPERKVWQPESTTEIYQFIGKDIQYFHALFWAAILRATGRRLPTQIIVNGFLSLNSTKISKSRQVQVRAQVGAEEFLEAFEPEVYRFFVARRSTGSMADINLDLADMKQLYNHIVIGKIVNIASRSSSFFQHYFQNQLAESYLHTYDRAALLERHAAITQAYNQRQFHKVIEKVEGLADLVNKQFSALEPWNLIHTDPLAVQRLCTSSLQQFYIIMRWLKPILPILYTKARAYVQDPTEDLAWDNCIAPLTHQTISSFTTIAHRVK